MLQVAASPTETVNRQSLRKLGRLWAEGRTGQVRDSEGAISLIRGDVESQHDLQRLIRVLRQPDKLRFRERELPGMPRPLLGGALFRAALEVVDSTTLQDNSSIARTELVSQIERLPVSDLTYRFYERNETLQSLIRLPRETRLEMLQELAALVLLGLYRKAMDDPEEQEVLWLKAEFRRLAQTEPGNPRAVVGVGPGASADQVSWLARRKVERCVQLREHRSPKVRQVALQVGAAIMAAAREAAASVH